MEGLLGTSVPVFIGVTVVLMGFAAFMTGQAMANGWQPMWKCIPYALLLTCGDRFLIFALFGGELLSVTGYVIDFIVLAAISLAAYRATLARKMASQYPWLYRRQGLFGWTKKTSG